MSVTQQTTYAQATGNGVTTVFPFQFLTLVKTDLSVYIDGVLKVVDADYTVSGLGALTGGNVTFSVAPGNGLVVSIIRTMRRERTTDYQTLGDFRADTVDLDIDRTVLLEQDLYTQVGRSIRTPDSEVATLPTLPSIAARSGKYISFDANGQPIASGGTGNDTAFRTDVANSGAGTDGSLLMGFRRAEAGAVAMSVHAVLNGWLTPEMFGAVGNAVTDDTAAWQACIAASETLNNKTILAQEKEYYIAGSLTLHQGTMIVGFGSQGSSEAKGFTFLHGGAGNLLTWDGNGASNQGTGGGLRNCLIVKKTGVTGGNAINLIATDDNHRPGEMLFENVLIYALGTGQWVKALFIDGTACNTPGARGVRDLWFNKFRLGGCSSVNQWVHIKQVSNMNGQIQMDTASGTGTLGMTIDDYWDLIDLDVRVGNIIVNYTGVDNPSLNLRGRCSTLDINHSSVIGIQTLQCQTQINNASQLVRISSNLADAWAATISSTVGNVTGDGTLYTVLFDSEDHDPNLVYDPVTGIATLKCAGLMQFNWSLVLTSLGAAHTTGEMFLLHKDSGGTNKNNISFKYGVGPMRDAANQCSLSNQIELKVSEGDTVRVNIQVSGSTKTVGVGGAAGTRYCLFTGKLLA